MGTGYFLWSIVSIVGSQKVQGCLQVEVSDYPRGAKRYVRSVRAKLRSERPLSFFFLTLGWEGRGARGRDGGDEA